MILKIETKGKLDYFFSSMIRKIQFQKQFFLGGKIKIINFFFFLHTYADLSTDTLLKHLLIFFKHSVILGRSLSAWHILTWQYLSTPLCKSTLTLSACQNITCAQPLQITSLMYTLIHVLVSGWATSKLSSFSGGAMLLLVWRDALRWCWTDGRNFAIFPRLIPFIDQIFLLLWKLAADKGLSFECVWKS